MVDGETRNPYPTIIFLQTNAFVWRQNIAMTFLSIHRTVLRKFFQTVVYEIF